MEEIVCPNCGYEQCYFNGVCYECPDCEHEWDCVEDEEDNSGD
jgi:uncharacterized Zn ribbon protein